MEKIGENANIRKIAITGAISSGKSTLSNFLEKLGAYVVKADELVHELLSSDPETIKQVTTTFGDVLTNGTIDRKKLSKIVFPLQGNVEKLEAILHPKVLREIKNRYEKASSLPHKAFVVEFPLLFEIGFSSWFDTIVYVKASPSTRKERFIAKGFSEEEFEKRASRFLPEREKIARSDVVINNEGSLSLLEKAAHQLL